MKRVLVTGASQNIGKQIAIEFAKLGAHIVVTARNEKLLKQVNCAELNKLTQNFL